MSSYNRMTREQLAQLALAISSTAEALGQSLTADAAELMADDLADYPAQVIAAALKACRRELVGRFTLAAIVQRIQAADGRPGKDEGWSIALASTDESDTVVLTDEISQAMSASQPILDAGDRVGARMAFMSAYERLVSLARAEAKPVQWRVSLGFEPSRRVAAIEQAVRSRLISAEDGQKHLGHLLTGPITQDGMAIAGLLTGNVVKPTEQNMARWQELRSVVQGAKRRKDVQHRWNIRKEKRHLQALKDAQMAKVEQLMKKDESQ